MRRTFMTLVFITIISMLSFGQPLTGVKNIPGDYATVALAISALNANGVGSGGVIFDVVTGHTETFSNDSAGLIKVSGSESDRIVFQRNGPGVNPVITGFPSATGTANYVFALKGVDYITFDGIDVAGPAGVVEWGYAVLKANAQKGSHYNIIRNCNISLKKSNTATIGIYSANITPNAPSSQLTVDAVNGSNSYNKYYNNIISGCYTGIAIDGYNDPTVPYSFYDQANEIGKDGGNQINDFGGGTVASNGIKTSYQDRLVFANNSVIATVAGTGACNGIQLGTAKNANVNFYNNTVSITMSDATTATFYGIYNNMGTSFTNNIYNFYSNTVSNCTYPKATSANVNYIYNTISAQTVNVYNNNVQNNTYGSGTATATGNVYGMNLAGVPLTTVPTIEIHGNNISGNSRTQSALGGGLLYCMQISGGKSGSYTSVFENTINNNSTSTTGLLAGFYFLNIATYKNLYKNTVTNLTSSNGIVYGAYSGEGYNQYIYNNKFQNLKTLASTTSGYVYGLYCSGSSLGGPMYVYNNMISELKAPNATLANSLYGIYGFGSGLNLLGIYNNTVYLDGTSTNLNFGSAAVYLSALPGSIDLRNNIFVNNTTPTDTGKALAMKSNAYSFYTPGPSNFTATINNNLYYAGTPGPNHVICQLTDGTTTFNDVTLSNYKTRVWPLECYSFTELPSFVETSVSPYDLHINTAIAAQCESAGSIVSTPISITADFDQDARYPNPGYPENPLYPAVGTDVGADEFAGIPNDQLPPAILYTALQNTGSTDPRVLTATISDVHGVPVAGDGLPRIAWKKFNNGIWNFEQGVSIGNSQYTFTFGGGVHVGDTVYYYVIAQDLFGTPNVGTFPMTGSSGFSSNPPAASVPPSPLYSYKIITGRCGTYTVGVGKDFPTLTAALNDMMGEGLNCPVVLELTDNFYASETYPIIINPIPGASATTTLTIRPAAGATPLFSTSYPGVSPNPWSMISLNGAQYLIFDGSNSGGNDRSMTFINSAGGGFAAPIGLYNNGTTPASYITIKNCVLRAHSDILYNAQGLTFYTIQGNGGYHDIIIHNNEINSAKFGLSIGGTSNYPTQNIQVTNNTIGSMDPSKVIYRNGIEFNYINNLLIEGNEIIGVAAGAAYPAQSPMLIYASTNSNNVTIRKNKIHDLWSTSTGAFGIYWDASSATTTLTEISNNLIYNIKSVGTSTALDGANGVGLFIRTGSNFKIVHNTISMQGNFLGATTAALSSCVVIRNSITGIDFRNNLLSNTSQPISGTPATKTYCIMVGTSPIFTNLDNNDFHSNGINAKVGYYGAADRATLADWQAACGQDPNSVSVNPVFTNDSTMIPTTTLMPKKGIYLAGFPLDFAGVTRTNPPDIGAYEFSTMPSVITTAAAAITEATATLNGTVNAMGHTANIYFDYGLTTGYGSTVDGNPAIVTGNSTENITASITGLEPNTTYHFRLRGITFTGVIVYGNDMTFTTSDLPCEVPTGVSASAITATTATISWVAPASAPGMGYQYEIRTFGDPGSGSSGLITSGNTMAGDTNADISGLTASTVYNAYVRSNCGDGSYSVWTTVVNFVTMAENLSVTGVVGNGNVNCYNATNIITVAGNGTTFEVQNGGSATFIAGQMISFLPGTTVLEGGYMHGYITLTNEYCSSLVNPVVNNPLQLGEVKATMPEISKTQRVIAYPNPTTGLFTLEMNRNSESTMSKVEVYSISGVKVLSQDLAGEQKHQFSLDGMSSGVYFIHVTATSGLETLKMIKL